MTAQERIEDIEYEMARTQKNKATAGHLGLLKARLAKLKRELLLGNKKSGPAGEGTFISCSKKLSNFFSHD